MNRIIKIGSRQLKEYFGKDDYVEFMEMYKVDSGEGSDVKLIRKAIKKSNPPTFNNVADKVKKHFGVIKLRRLLDTYEEVEWNVLDTKQVGKGRPTKNYERIK